VAAVGMRSEHVRRANLSTVLRRVHAAPLTRSQLSEATGLTRTAIASLVATLVEEGLVREDDSAARTGPGRPSPVVSGAKSKVSVGVEITADTIAVAVVALGGAILASARVPRPDGRAGPAQVVRAVVDLASAALGGDVPSPPRTVLGVGVAVAGVVDRTDGRVVVAPNIGWSDVPLRTLVADAFQGRVPVAVANEADLGMLAECGRGAAVGRRDVVYISGEVGVGGGVLVDGVPLRGASGFAGELGHIPVRPDGVRCRCGARGCWETEIGEAAVLRRASGQRARRGRRAVEALLARATDRDDAALAALRETGEWIGVGLSGLVNLLNPELIVLGGFFAEAFEHLQPGLVAELDARALAATRARVSIVPAALGIDAALIGAAELGFEAVLADPVSGMQRALG
jgi:predicted NBD/HSP70 family sugar kinase